jgi:Tfp pilus assembly protein PilO
MTRVQMLLTGLAALLLVVLFWLLLWSPQQDELAEIQDDIQAAQDRQRLLAGERDALRAVRDEAPTAAAELAAASAVMPEDQALPSSLRQFQQAADEAGVTLRTISPSRPQQVDDAPAGVSRIGVSFDMAGSYFQIVDFLRRVEDPSITPRAMIVSQFALNRAEYPELNVTLGGAIYTRLPQPPPDEPEESENDEDDPDVEIDVDAEEGDQ